MFVISGTFDANVGIVNISLTTRFNKIHIATARLGDFIIFDALIFNAISIKLSRHFVLILSSPVNIKSFAISILFHFECQ